jgi:hypothetical protein
MKYSLDTSSAVEPWQRRYPSDVFPTLWNTYLPGLIASGDLNASEEVHQELSRQDDDVLAWAESQPGLFVELDGAVQSAVKAILGSHSTLVDIRSGRSGADPLVIALAQVNGATVVTEEQPKPTKPRIPDVCAALGVPCINMLDLIRSEGWHFS